MVVESPSAMSSNSLLAIQSQTVMTNLWALPGATAHSVLFSRIRLLLISTSMAIRSILLRWNALTTGNNILIKSAILKHFKLCNHGSSVISFRSYARIGCVFSKTSLKVPKRQEEKEKEPIWSCPNLREMQPLMDIICLVTPCITRFQHIRIAFPHYKYQASFYVGGKINLLNAALIP